MIVRAEDVGLLQSPLQFRGLPFMVAASENPTSEPKTAFESRFSPPPESSLDGLEKLLKSPIYSTA
jgi:hypothetical protein